MHPNPYDGSAAQPGEPGYVGPVQPGDGQFRGGLPGAGYAAPSSPIPGRGVPAAPGYGPAGSPAPGFGPPGSPVPGFGPPWGTRPPKRSRRRDLLLVGSAVLVTAVLAVGAFFILPPRHSTPAPAPAATTVTVATTVNQTATVTTTALRTSTVTIPQTLVSTRVVTTTLSPVHPDPANLSTICSWFKSDQQRLLSTAFKATTPATKGEFLETGAQAECNYADSSTGSLLVLGVYAETPANEDSILTANRAAPLTMLNSPSGYTATATAISGLGHGAFSAKFVPTTDRTSDYRYILEWPEGKYLVFMTLYADSKHTPGADTMIDVARAIYANT